MTANADFPGDQSLEQIEGDAWGDPPADATKTIATAYKLRRTPIQELTNSDLRLLVAQRIGLETLMPSVLTRLEQEPLLEGDALAAVLRVPMSYGESHPDQRVTLECIITTVENPNSDVEHREDWNVVQRLDADNTAWLAEIIAAHGWPGHALVGTDGAHAAWLLAQHATLQHQVRWLDLLREAVEHGDAQSPRLAYFEDRVQLHQGLPQRYGTQWIGNSEHASRLAPLTEPTEVNARRAAVGLPSIDEHDLDNAWHFDQLRGLRPRKA